MATPPALLPSTILPPPKPLDTSGNAWLGWKTWKTNERVVPETFYIIEQNVPVTLSGSVAERLGFICRIQHIEVDELYPPAQHFAEVFSGLGELKGYEYEIKLKPGAVGVIVPARRIPMALEGKTRAELQRMEDQGVITKLQGFGKFGLASRAPNFAP
ncbi:uncharacterized protein LOC125941552 [Dermacentor silvarum]|uniref:uncharacterized protein LOC125941552 n=1 Tax=Dermacentor silvarum TaxID=543639 RepID=UPI00210109AA|nr:uncharacterized protein LOC125941552 [Dermacentor silvarum]